MRKILVLLIVATALQQSCSTTGQHGVEKKQLADSTSFYTIEMAYPIDERDASHIIQTAFNEEFEMKKEEWKMGGAIQKAEAEITKDFPDRVQIKYGYFVDYETIETSKKDWVAYVFDTYEYTGGANGMQSVRTFSFSDEKKQIKIEDIVDFSNNKDIELSRILAKEALRDTSIFMADFVNPGLGLAYLKADGKTVDLQACRCDGFYFGSNFQNFAITDKGITFYFDKYTLAPGAAGITHVALTWEQLKPFLKNSFKVK